LLAEVFPLASLWLRFWRPGLFQTGIHLDYERSGGRLTVRPRSTPWLGLLFNTPGRLLKCVLAEVARDLKTIILSETVLLPLFKTIHPTEWQAAVT